LSAVKDLEKDRGIAMGLDIFFLEDIRNALLAADEASSGTIEVVTNQNARTLDSIAEKLREELPANSQPLLVALHTAAVGNMDAMRHYRQGYKAALTTMALAFGLSPAIITSREDTLEVQARVVGRGRAIACGGIQGQAEPDTPSAIEDRVGELRRLA
jgi:phage tail sheath protein FI